MITNAADDLEIEDLPPLPPGAPPDFRERLVLTLKTTNAGVLARAEQDFRGIYPSPDAYIRDQLAEHLPGFMTWILNAADPDKLREGYQGKALVVWSIPTADGKAMIFESELTA